MSHLHEVQRLHTAHLEKTLVDIAIYTRPSRLTDRREREEQASTPRNEEIYPRKESERQF